MQADATRAEVGRYQLLEQLGRGATGIVYRARDPLIRRTVAVKVLHFSQGLAPDRVQLVRERFFREAQAAGNLDHPNIVRIFDVGEDESGRLYIVMEYVPGPSLDRLFDERPLDLARIEKLLAQIASGLDAAHARGIIHRDVKAANVLMTEDHTPKITDFGIARITDSCLTQDARYLGTPYSMAPEQIEGKTLDGRTDLFSLGVICYQLLTGRRPFEAEDAVSIAYQIVHSTPTPVSVVNPELPRALDGVMERILAKEPEDRYASGLEFHEAFAACLSPAVPGRIEKREVSGRSAPTDLPTRGTRAALWGLGAVASMAVALGVFALLRGGEELPSPRPTAPAATSRAVAPSAGDPGEAGTPSGAPRPASPASSRTSAPKSATPRAPRPAPTATTTITIAHRISRGTLTVLLDGKPLLSDEFSKGRWTPFHMTQWSALTVPSGSHRLTAQVKGGDGKIYRSEPYPVRFEAGKDTALRISFKDGALLFKEK